MLWDLHIKLASNLIASLYPLFYKYTENFWGETFILESFILNLKSCRNTQ